MEETPQNIWYRKHLFGRLKTLITVVTHFFKMNTQVNQYVQCNVSKVFIFEMQQHTLHLMA